jgi:hypothetical protein
MNPTHTHGRDQRIRRLTEKILAICPDMTNAGALTAAERLIEHDEWRRDRLALIVDTRSSLQLLPETAA